MLAKIVASLAFVLTAAGQAQTTPSSSAPQSTATANPTGPIDAVKSWLNPLRAPAPADLLPPDEAFTLSLRATDANTVVATLTPADGYYLYRDRISFRVEDPPGLTVAGVTLPPGKFKEDPTFGRTEVYYGPTEAIIRLDSTGAAPASVRLYATYQGCNDPIGVCYPPIEKTLTLALTSAGGTPASAGAGGGVASPATSSATGGALATPNVAGGDASETGRVLQLFSQGGRWAMLAAFFGFGVLLAFTPCMLPMIPILSGIIVGRGQHATKRRAVGLSAVYVLGMAITYAAAGVAAGLAGSMLSAALQNPWVLGSFAAVFVLLALSMFGLFELQLPSGLQSTLAGVTHRIPGGHVTGVFLMGVVSAVIVGPCVAAPLAGALLYIGQTRDAVLGGAALFSMAVGMGVPLIVVGATASTIVRRAGPWTQSVMRMFGVSLLAVAIYLISPVIPLVVQHLLWATLLIVAAMFARAIDPLPGDAPGISRLIKGLGVIGLVAGVALLVGAFSGSRDLLQPLVGMRAAAGGDVRDSLPFEPVKSVAALDARVQAAGGRFVMVDFWAEWCVSCKEMERFTFADPRVQARLKEVILLRADVTANNADDQALLRRFSLFGPPGIVFFDAQGGELAYRVIGYEGPDKFLASLDRVLPGRSPQ